MKRHVALLALPLLALAACGGDDGGDDAAAATATATAGTAGTGTGTGDASDAGSAGSLAADPDSEWCGVARSVEDVSDQLDEVTSTAPADFEAAFAEMSAALDEAADAAPPELEDAIATQIDGFSKLRDALEAVDFDVLDVDLSVIDQLNAQMTASQAEIERYNEEVCGIPADAVDTADVSGTGTAGSADTSAFDPSAGTVREQIVQALVAQGFTEDEAGCVIDAIDINDPAALQDVNGLFDVFEGCGIDDTRLAELGG